MRIVKTLVVTLCALALFAPAALALNVGDPAPDFELPIFQSDKTFKMADVRGKKAVVLAVTQSACASCRSELALINGWVGTEGIEVLTINVDVMGGSERWNGLMSGMVEKSDLKMPILVDPKYSVPRMFGVRATPSLIVIDKAGNVKAVEVGYVPGEDNESYTKLINSVK